MQDEISGVEEDWDTLHVDGGGLGQSWGEFGHYVTKTRLLYNIW